MTDYDAIQGLWRLVSCIARGSSLGTATTHFQFEKDKVKEIVPSQVEGGSWATFQLDPETSPKRFTMTNEWAGKNNSTIRRVDCWVYELTGDTLRLCWPSVFGEYPDQLSEQIHGVFTLNRDNGPPPVTKRASGKQPTHDSLLGEVKWNDNFDNWEAQVELKAGLQFNFTIEPHDGSDAIAIEAGRNFFGWLRSNELAARRFAASQLLDDHNANWNNGDPITASRFAKLFTLESAALSSDGRASLYYEDGDLFAGHCIIVSISNDLQFKDAYIAG